MILNTRRLTNHLASDTMPAFSPTGDLITFALIAMAISKSTLAAQPQGTPGTLRRVINHSGANNYPRFSPDGKRLIEFSRLNFRPEDGVLSGLVGLLLQSQFGPAIEPLIVHLILTRTVFAALPSTVTVTSTSPRPIKLRGTSTLT